MLHPGPGYQPATLRWTANFTGNVRVNVSFGAGDIGAVSYRVTAGGGVVDFRPAGTTPYSTPTFTFSVSPGWALDASVADGYHAGTTPLLFLSVMHILRLPPQQRLESQ